MNDLEALHVWLDHVVSQDEGNYLLIDCIGGLYWAADMRSLDWSWGYTHEQAVESLADYVEDEQNASLPQAIRFNSHLVPSE